MLAHGFPFDTVQMPLNCFDGDAFAASKSNVVPAASKRGMAPIGMKSLGGGGQAVQAGVVDREEALRYAMSVPGVTVTVSGIDRIDVLRQNLAIARGFEPMSADEMEALRARVAGPAADGRFELYKTTKHFDAQGRPRAARLSDPGRAAALKVPRTIGGTRHERDSATPAREDGGAGLGASVSAATTSATPKSYDEVERIVHEAVDAGVTFFDNCWEYHNGRTEEWLGRALASSGKRKSLFLDDQGLHPRATAALALKMLDESLRRLRTDHLDLWQIHGVAFDNDPELAYGEGRRPRGAGHGEASRQSAIRRVHRAQGPEHSSEADRRGATPSTRCRCRSTASTPPGAASSSACCPRRTSAASPCSG